MHKHVAWLVAIAAALTMTVSYVDRSVFSALAPTVTKALDIDPTQYGVLTALFSVAYLIATPLSGWWLDRVGARRGLVVSVIAWSAIAACHSVVAGFTSLLILRMALGIAEGPGFPGAAQTVQSVLPANMRSRGFGLVFAGSSIGGVLAPPIASALYDRVGWRSAFLLSAAVGLAWVPLWIAATRRPDVRARLDARPAADAPRTSASALLRHPMMIRALIAIFAVAPVLGFGFSWGAKYLADTLGVAQGDIGHYLWLPPLMLAVGAIGAGDLATRQRRAPGAAPRGLYALGALLATCLVLLPLATTPWQASQILAVGLAGGGALYTLTTSDLLARLPTDSTALAGGILACAQSLSFVIANPLIGACVKHLHEYSTISIILGAWVVPGSLVWIVWPVAEKAGSNAQS